MKNIVETAMSDKEFDTLVKALKKADLVDTLSGEGPYTVFAPTNKAFESLPKDKLEDLLEDKEALGNILKYHVVPGKVMAKDVAGLKEANTVLGKKVRIDTKKGVKINNSNVIKTDIETSNGVIHIIDKPLIPE